jgi:arginyl-tRNA synthetase
MKESLRDTLKKIVTTYSKARGFSLPEDFVVELEASRDPAHGDLSTPVAFRLAKWAKAKPAQIADELLLLFEKEIGKRKEEERGVTRWQVAGGGFLNFSLSASRLAQILVEIHQTDSQFGRSEFGQGKKILIEFVSANPTGPLTIAHGRQAVVGDALARILQAAGFKVTKEYYLNDTGRQIGLLGESLWVRYQELFGREGNIPEEGYRGAYLKEIAEKLKRKRGDSLLTKGKEDGVRECTQFAVTEILHGIKEDLKEVRVEFDSYLSERTLREERKVEKAIEVLKGKGLVWEEEGALWFRSTKFGDDKDRVIRKQTGDYTYLAPDIAYHWLKFERGFDRLVNLWGPDHHGYIPRIKAACEALGYSSEQLKVLIVQLVTLFRKGEPVRMSTRAGEFVTLRELFQEVGVDATRFFFLLRRVESHLDFDLDLAKLQSEENPVYYLQYAHARISSILKFAQRRVDPHADLTRLGAPEETELMKRLQEFPEILVQAAQALEPYRVVEYLREVATQFHKFYTLHRVVTDDPELTRARLLLVDAVRIVLRNGLHCLGVSHPETM